MLQKSPYMSKYWVFSAAFGGFSKVVPFAFFRPLESPYMSKSGVNPRFSKSPYMSKSTVYGIFQEQEKSKGTTFAKPPKAGENFQKFDVYGFF